MSKELKYVMIKNDIIDFIERGEYSEDSLVPSERVLMVKYNVSRITIRKALDDLQNAGYLYKVHGKGTFVKGDRHTQNLFSIVSCTEDIKSMGMIPSRAVINKSIVVPSVKKRSKLQLSTNDKVFSLTRIYYADDSPVNYTATYLPEKYFRGIEVNDFSKNSLYAVIEKEYGIKISKAVRSIEAVSAPNKIAKYLKIEDNTPLILFSTITYGIVNGREVPIEYFDCYYHTDQFKFYINQTR